jgi:hypothetical protein
MNAWTEASRNFGLTSALLAELSIHICDNNFKQVTNISELPVLWTLSIVRNSKYRKNNGSEIGSFSALGDLKEIHILLRRIA